MIVAFDMDASEKKQVLSSLKRFISELEKIGIDLAIYLEVWDRKLGKGIDDVLAGGGKTELVTGPQIWVTIQKFEKQLDQAQVPFIVLDEVEEKKVEFLIKPYLPKRKLSILEGDPGVGKSYVTASIAAAISKGGRAMGVQLNTSGKVLILNGEDDVADTIKPRLMKFSANLKNIIAQKNHFVLDDEGVETLEIYLRKYNPVLVIIDPIVSSLGGNVDMHRANEVRGRLSPLVKLAAIYDCSILIVRHLNKDSRGKSLYRGQGSIDFVAACRSAMLIGKDNQNKDIRALFHTKASTSKEGEPIAYTITDDGFEWLGKTDLKIHDVLASDMSQGSNSSALDEAKEFLEKLLSEKVMSAKEVQDYAADEGISKASLKRAKKELGVRSVKISIEGGKQGEGGWSWTLKPEKDSVVQEGQCTGTTIMPPLNPTTDHLDISAHIVDKSENPRWFNEI